MESYQFGQTPANFTPILMRRAFDGAEVTARSPADVRYYEFAGYVNTTEPPAIANLTADTVRTANWKLRGQWDFEVAPTVNGQALGTGGSSTGGTGTAGRDGREVFLENDGINIRWRYSGTSTYTNLVSVASLRGPMGPVGIQGPQGATGFDGFPGAPGRNPEFRRAGGYIQWRLVGDANWQNLLALSEITGPAGSGSGGTTPSQPATVLFYEDSTGAVIFDPGTAGHPTLDSDGALVYDMSLGNPTQDADGALVFSTI